MMPLELHRDRQGFSLIELLVVIVVIGILASLAMRSMDVAVEDMRQLKTEREMAELAKAIVGDPTKVQSNARSDFGFVGDIGAFPPNLQALMSNTGGWATWDGPYLSQSLVQDAVGYRLDEWGQAYTYSGGVTISSTGSGSTISHKIADQTTDYTTNSVHGVILDIAGLAPGTILADSIDIEITIPDGAGGLLTKTYQPDSVGAFTLDTIPAGIHPLTCVYHSEVDTLFRYIAVMPRHRSRLSLRFAYAHFFSGSLPTSPDTLLAADFDTDEDGFVYHDDTFRGSSEPDYASGSWEAAGGYSGGGLQVDIGGINGSDIVNMSGGWERLITMPEPGNVRLSFRYELEQTAEYESDEYSHVLVSFDGILYGNSPNDYVDIITGNGPGGGDSPS